MLKNVSAGVQGESGRNYIIQAPSGGIYEIHPDRYYVWVPERGPALFQSQGQWHNKQNYKTVSQYNFQGSKEHKTCIDDMNSFFSSKEVYEKLSINHKRGIILYGPPGTGKSAIALAMQVHAIGLGIPVFRLNREDQFGVVNGIDDKFNKLIIVEQIERFIGDLSLCVDDMEPHTFIVGTTNEPSLMHERLTRRPGRFDRLIKVDRMAPGMILKLAEKYNLLDCIDILKKYPVITPAQLAEMSLRLNVYGYEKEDAINSVIEEFYK